MKKKIMSNFLIRKRPPKSGYRWNAPPVFLTQMLEQVPGSQREKGIDCIFRGIYKVCLFNIFFYIIHSIRVYHVSRE